MGIFDKRVTIEPVEYPTALEFVDAINQSMWFHTEWNFQADIQDYKVNLNPSERGIVKRALLAIAQIEVSVKKFWAKLPDVMDKPEFGDVGYSFAESEVRHKRAYKHLLTIMGIDNEFETLLNVPEIQNRIEYLSKYLKGVGSNAQERYTLTLALFSLFTENVSLFSQFLIVKSFNQHKKVLKDIDNVIQATQKEETIHALFGAYLIGEIRKEFPEWFNEEFTAKFHRACKKAYEAELGIVKWIYSEGDLEWLTFEQVDEFLKHRFNESLTMIGLPPLFEVDYEIIKSLDWFITELTVQVQPDFFNKKSNNYTKNTKPVTADELF